LRAAVLDQRLGGPTEHVYETGRNGESADVNFLTRADITKISHRGDAVSVYRNVTSNRWISAAVVDKAAAQDEIVLRLSHRETGTYRKNSTKKAGFGQRASNHYQSTSP
jgi:hypothetical protein